MSGGRPGRALAITLGLTLLVACQSPPADPPPSGKAGSKPAKDSGPLPATGLAADGKQLFVTRGCVACHRAPGVPEAQGTIGPNLAGLASRPKIAGTLDNTSDNMLKWLMNPPAMKPGTAMPSIGLGEEEARKLAAFMETLR